MLSTVGMRVLVHIVSITIARLLDPVIGESFFLTYFGLICLFPRGDVRSASWAIPVVCGLVQGVVLFFIQGFLPVCLFGAGLQSWLLRIIAQRGRLTWDLIVVPFLFYGLDCVRYYEPLGWMSLSFVVLAGLGVLAQYVEQRLHFVDHTMGVFKQDLDQMANLLRNTDLPKEYKTQLELLQKQAKLFATKLEGRVRDYFPLLRKIHLNVEELNSIVDQAKPSTSSGWAKGLLKNENWGRKQTNTSPIQVQLAETVQELQREVRKFKVGTADAELEEKWQQFEDKADALQMKIGVFPPEYGKHIEGIVQAVHEIVKNMRDDPADRTPGARFLERYLPTVDKILGEYERFANGPGQEKVQADLDRCLGILQRLEAAFIQESENLLRNDALNFSAELDTIDDMLKMKGH